MTLRGRLLFVDEVGLQHSQANAGRSAGGHRQGGVFSAPNICGKRCFSMEILGGSSCDL